MPADWSSENMFNYTFPIDENGTYDNDPTATFTPFTIPDNPPVASSSSLSWDDVLPNPHKPWDEDWFISFLNDLSAPTNVDVGPTVSSSLVASDPSPE
jgi:hypothetical protein